MHPKSQAHREGKKTAESSPYVQSPQIAVCLQKRAVVSQALVLLLFYLLYAVGFSREREKSSLNLPHAGGNVKVEEDTNNDLNLNFSAWAFWFFPLCIFYTHV